MVKRSALLALATVSALLALTGCTGSSSSPTSSPTPTSDDIQGGTQPNTNVPLGLADFPDSEELAAWCPLDVEAVHLHQLTATVSSAAVCSTSMGDDGFVTTTVSAVSGGLDELLDVYAVPNAPVEPMLSCTEQLENPLLVWVTYPGERSYPVYAPVDPCGFPTKEAKAAFTALELTPVVSFAETSTGVTTTEIGLGAPGAPAKETT